VRPEQFHLLRMDIRRRNIPVRNLGVAVPTHDDQIFDLVVRGVSVDMMNLQHGHVRDAAEWAATVGFLI